MDRLNALSESFKTKYERFLIGCDSIEELDQWDKEANGEMDVYYSNDIVSVIIRLIAADGSFSERETDYLNEFFGFDYTTEELKNIYDDCGEAIESLFDEDLGSGLSNMRAINEKLAEAYKDLLLTVCDIIIESDGVIDSAEVDLAKQLKDIAQLQ